MGRQINFFMTLADEEAFCDFVLSEEDVYILPSRVVAIPPQRLRSPLPAQCQSPLDRDLLIWHNGIFNDPEFVYHPAGSYSTAGSQKGGIEFTRCLIDNNTIRAGRLWTEHKSRTFVKLDGTINEPARKAAFDRWVNKLFRWIRKRYVKYAELFYIGPGAVQFQEMGGMLGPHFYEMDDPMNIQRRPF